MEVIETKLPGVVIIEPKVYGDERGFFLESFSVDRYKAMIGIDLPFVPDSPTYGQYESVVLSEENHRQFWVPPGYAHGFVVLSDVADFEYKCTDYYDPSDEGSVAWNDPEINIDWMTDKPLLSEKDDNAPTLAKLREVGVK